MNLGALKEPRPGRRAAICAGCYFAAAAAYFANAFSMAIARAQSPAVPWLLGAVALFCVAVAVLVLGENQHMVKGAVVIAGAFSGIHAIGLIFLIFDTSDITPPLVRSLQWQLGASFLFVWLTALGSAYANSKEVLR
jgi:hypothetical protein